MSKVFISYAKENYECAKRLYDDLKKEGYSPWIDEEDVLPGQIWKEEVKKNIEKSKFFILLISSNSVSKQGFFQKEQKIALDIYDELPSNSIFIIPVRLDNVEKSLDERLNALKWADLFPSYEKGLDKILRVLKTNNEPADRVFNAEKDEKPHTVPEKKVVPDIPVPEINSSNKRSVGIKGDAEKNTIIAGNGNIINIHSSIEEKINPVKRKKIIVSVVSILLIAAGAVIRPDLFRKLLEMINPPPPKYTLTIKIEPEKASADAEVKIIAPETHKNDKPVGKYMFKNLEPDKYIISVSHKDYSPKEEPIEI